MLVRTINRIKRAWTLAKTPNLVFFDETKITPEQLEAIKNSPGVISLPQEPIGDGDAVFIGEPTEEEQLDFEREQEGTKSWYDRLKKLV